MLLKFKKTASNWVSLYVDAIKNRCRRDLNLADVNDKAVSRANLELVGEVPDHWHDSRYAPMIENRVGSIQNIVENLTVSITGDVIGTSTKNGNNYTVTASNVVSTNSKLTDANGSSTMLVAFAASSGTQELMTNSKLKYVPSTGTLSASVLSSNSVKTGIVNADKVYNAVWNDFAEFFPKGEKTEPGDIIMLDMNSNKEQYIKAIEGRGNCIAGVHTNEFANLIGGEVPPEGEDYFEYNQKKFIPVGLAGRVHVKFIGKSEKGGLVVPSKIPGCGRLFDLAHDSRDAIIGYLVESDRATNIRQLKIKIK